LQDSYTFILSYFGFDNCNEATVSSSNKNVEFLTKLFTTKNSKNNPFQTSAIKRELVKNLQSNNMKNISNNTLFFQLSLLKVLQKTLVSSKVNVGNSNLSLFFFDAQQLAGYISKQMNDSNKYKSLIFKQKEPINALAKFSGELLKTSILNNELIAGIKIQLSGKWKQTTNGRKQKLTLLLGSINNQSIGFFFSLSNSVFTTKFGSCCIKVSICYKSFKS